MLKVMQIDFVRSVLETALKYNASGTTFFNDTDISLFSFYEQLTEEAEVNRYVERYQQLVSQQNKEDLIGFGILAVTDTPSITNLKKGFVSPFEWSCTVRCTLGNRDKMINTIYDLIERYKGKKQDIAQLDNGKLVPVGTFTNRLTMTIEDYDFIGIVESNADTEIKAYISSLSSNYGITNNAELLYCEMSGRLKLYEYNSTTSTWIDISEDNVPSHNSFEKLKIDLSFDDIKVDEPYTLDATQYCTISFGGTATLTTNNIKLGNDLTHVIFSKYKVKGATDYNFASNSYDLEPLEMPSGINANTIPNQLRSNFFKTNTHTDSVASSIQYTFLLDMESELLKQWFEYARYGINNLTSGQNQTIQQSSITPNIIYKVKEFWVSWGEINAYEYKGKIVEDIDVENTESDTMTISIALQVQGDND